MDLAASSRAPSADPPVRRSSRPGASVRARRVRAQAPPSVGGTRM